MGATGFRATIVLAVRAVVHDRYGPPDVLRVDDVERPAPGDGEVLVEVYASTVRREDAMHVRSREYWFARAFTGVRRPRRTSFGSEFAGRVVEVGGGVSAFTAGDDVFGAAPGANAEYVTVRESGVIAAKPGGLSYEQAAAIPDGALLALSCLRPAEPSGKHVLVYGAAGSIGSAAVQLLVNHFDAKVTAVCDTKDVDLVRSLGAHRVLDRFQEDFTKTGETYDVIYDAVGRHSFRRSRRALKGGGVYVSMDLGFMYHLPLLAVATRLAGSRRAKVGLGSYRQEDLELVRELVEEGKYRPVVDRVYPLDDVVEATRYVETGRKTGSVVLRVREAPL